MKLTFEEWQAKVNAYLVKKCGFGIDDLPDFDYYNYWADGISPSETAKEVYQAARDY